MFFVDGGADVRFNGCTVNDDPTEDPMRIVKKTSIKLDKDSTEKTARTWTFDFEGVDEKVIGDLACRDLVIRLAGMHRQGKPIPAHNATVMVADLVAGRAIMTPAEMVAAGLASMTKAERDALLKSLKG